MRDSLPPTGGLLIAIPTFNERENVGALLPTLLTLHPEAHVVVVDDNSPDGTGDIVAALARRDRRIHLIRRDRKRGLGSADFGTSRAEGDVEPFAREEAFGLGHPERQILG